jgi:WD40 repeat protein
MSTIEPERPFSNFATPISFDGKLIALFIPDDQAVRVYDTSSGKERFVIEPTGDALFSVYRFSPDGKHLITGDEWGGVQVWDMRSGQMKHSRQVHRSTVRRGPSNFTFSKDGQRYLSLSSDGSVQAWDSATHRIARRIQDTSDRAILGERADS